MVRHRTAPSRRTFLQQGMAAGLTLAAFPLAARAQEDTPERSAIDLMTRETQTAIDRGLTALAARQQKDGAFGSSGYSRNVAVCALGGMAFMASGSTPGRGKFGLEVDRCVDYVLHSAQDNGFITIQESASHGPMYGHGFATLFLAEAYGMSMRDEIREKLGRAVELIIRTQAKDGVGEGGWRYQPQPSEADISVTVCQMMALRAARNAGIYVPPETRDKCVEYVKRCQNPDGGFMYMAQGGQSAFPRSAAGIVALNSADIYEGEEIEKGLSYLMQFLPSERTRNSESHYFYGHYYAVQAMWHAGGKYWQTWYPAIRDQLLRRQRDDGMWSDDIGREYGTAMATIVLQMPNNYLPIFQR